MPTYLQLPNVEVKRTSVEVKDISTAITVLIDGENPGSGVIVNYQDETYHVLTTKHVVENSDEYEIITSDGERYPVNYSSIKKLPGVDLAVVPFTSSRNYLTAELGDFILKSEDYLIYSLPEILSVQQSNR